MFANKIKALRSSNGWTQSILAKKLGITRSSVNAWEMGISVPSTSYIVELAQLFHVSTDFLLGLNHNASLDISGLDGEKIKILNELVLHFKKKNLILSHIKKGIASTCDSFFYILYSII